MGIFIWMNEKGFFPKNFFEYVDLKLLKKWAHKIIGYYEYSIELSDLSKSLRISQIVQITGAAAIATALNIIKIT